MNFKRTYWPFSFALGGMAFLALDLAPIRAGAAEKLFAKHCAVCHGKDGKARTPVARKLGVKDLSRSTASDAEMETQILEGRKDERGVQRMPAFKDKLSPEEIQSLISFVKEFRE